MSNCKRPLLALILAAIMLLLSGCESLAYYTQSVRGHLHVMAASRDIDKLLADTTVDADLKQRLQQVRAIRSFASEQLQLPDNGSYLEYADLKRKAMVWSVLATPADSLTPKQWCYPVIGCAAYRGYFDQDEAEAYARRLQAQGLDTAVLPVPAYSTLGWFDDPLPSTVIHWPEYSLAGLIFHELAHQKLYVKGDSRFNESYASVVEEEGVRRWLDRLGDQSQIEQWREAGTRKQDFHRLLQQLREALLSLYQQPLDSKQMLERKQQYFANLHKDYQQLKKHWNGYSGYDVWMGRSVNNAHLAGINLYRAWVPALRIMLAQQAGDMADFHGRCQAMAGMPQLQREARLQALVPDVTVPADTSMR